MARRRQRVKVFDMTSTVQEILNEYGEELTMEVKQDVMKLSPKIVSKVTQNSPRRTGEYASGWTEETEQTTFGIRKVIYNNKKPTLTHLLEYGHAKQNGGRVKGHRHIKTTQEWANEELWEMVRKDVGQ